jgi:hypothetical protein
VADRLRLYAEFATMVARLAMQLDIVALSLNRALGLDRPRFVSAHQQSTNKKQHTN